MKKLFTHPKYFSYIIIVGYVLWGCPKSFSQSKTKKSYSEPKPKSKSYSKSDDYISGENIPYGFLDFDFSISNSRKLQNQLIPYNDNGIMKTRIGKDKRSVGSGLGMEVHAPLLYMWLNNDNSRFRIADDIGCGVFGLSGFGLQAFAGVQTAYRINAIFDIGVKYYPYYLHFDSRNRLGAIEGNAYGVHARISSVYLDFTSIKAKNGENPSKPARFNSLRLKWYYGDFVDADRNYNYISLSFGTAKYATQPWLDPNLEPAYQEYGTLKNKYTFIKLGWGITF